MEKFTSPDLFLPSGEGSWYNAQVKSTFGKIYIPKLFFISRGGRRYITQVKCTFGKICIPKFFFIPGGGREGGRGTSQSNVPLEKFTSQKYFCFWGREGIHSPNQIYLQKNLHPISFFIPRGGEGVHCPSQMYLWKNLHPNLFFISEGGREGCAAQVKCTFGKIYTTKIFSFLGEGGRKGVHHPNQIYLRKNLHPPIFFIPGGGREAGGTSPKSNVPSEKFTS